MSLLGSFSGRGPGLTVTSADGSCLGFGLLEDLDKFGA